MNFGTPTGTLAHLTGELFRIRTGIEFVVIPYKGAATAVTDILAAQVDMAFEPTSVLVSHIHDGKVRPLGITGAARSRELPAVPTMIESGIADFTSYSWTAIMAAQRHAGGGRDQAQCRDQPGLKFAGDRFDSEEAQRRGEDRFAAGFRGLPRRGNAEMGGDREVIRGEARLIGASTHQIHL